MSGKRALITGITGQDGSYLAELLLDKGYEVHGMVRRSSTENFERINHLTDRIALVQADLLDPTSLAEALEEAHPNEVYNLGAQSFVPTSWKQPDYYLALPWHFLDEFLQRETEFLERGGRFIVPLPDVRVVPADR